MKSVDSKIKEIKKLKSEDIDKMSREELFEKLSCLLKRNFPTTLWDEFPDAFDIIGMVQKKHPGWRFRLMGGETSFGYNINLKGDFTTDKSKKEYFGWEAEFFGEADPRINFGQRHGESHDKGMVEAILKASLKALISDQIIPKIKSSKK